MGADGAKSRAPAVRIVIEISVIIPTFDRADLVDRCLNALARQTAAPASYEVVVVDDGSTDRTRALLGSYDAPFSLRTQSQPNSGQASARNRAIEIARGRFCLFLDDDIEADPGLVDGHLRAQRAHGGVIGIGMLRLRLSGPRGGLSSYFASWWQRHYEQLENGTLQPDFRACFSGESLGSAGGRAARQGLRRGPPARRGHEVGGPSSTGGAERPVHPRGVGQAALSEGIPRDGR